MYWDSKCIRSPSPTYRCIQLLASCEQLHICPICPVVLIGIDIDKYIGAPMKNIHNHFLFLNCATLLQFIVKHSQVFKSANCGVGHHRHHERRSGLSCLTCSVLKVLLC